MIVIERKVTHLYLGLNSVVLPAHLRPSVSRSAFYTGALNNFTGDDFINDGLPQWARGRFEQIAAHEQAHVQLLSSALGANATQACNYSFPYTSPSSFAALSQLLEGVGVSAYAGAAQYIRKTRNPCRGIMRMKAR
ncbi:ferritin-like domain-containing protein [Lentinula boryana]|uniref:Ferritin-like domain-containing protein n=1 Tax=Lentinula boryana TaxID=40481 RepID=A0ABQ8PWX4_9AGAR|nr:ferritin-like domain-containing protein [Lentinula boryana]